MDKRGFFQIGDVAKLFHLSVGSLRHYEKAGLLSPEYIDPETGYRYYSTRQFEVLNTIRYLRVLDMPLTQIAEFLRNRDVEHIQELLLAQKETVARKKRELEIIEKKIDNRLSQLQDALDSELNVIRVAAVPERRIAVIRDSLAPRSYLDLEVQIRKLEGQQKDALVFLGKIGVGITKEKLMANQYEQYDLVFLLLDPEDEYEGEVQVVPEEVCVTLRFCGSHQEAPAQYEKLLAYVREQGLEIAGAAKEITMIDYGITNDTSRFVTEIQIPVINPFLSF